MNPNNEDMNKFDETKQFEEPNMDFPPIQQNPSIKITKNTKGYNFEFKILNLNIEELDKIHNSIIKKIKQWEKEDGN